MVGVIRTSLMLLFSELLLVVCGVVWLENRTLCGIPVLKPNACVCVCVCVYVWVCVWVFGGEECVCGVMGSVCWSV